MAELSQATKNLLAKYEVWQALRNPKENAPKIHVDEVAARVAAFYEKIHTVVDWKEEHLMRRGAIIRKLKRRFQDLELDSFSAQNMAEGLVLDLIRGGYFPNDKIEELKIPNVQKIIDKYIFILKNNLEKTKSEPGKRFYNSLLGIAACEIEEELDPSVKEMALIEYMFVQMKEKIKVEERVFKNGLLKAEDKDIQIYIAVQQALFKLDNPIIQYNIIRYSFPQWSNPTEEELAMFSQDIEAILHNIAADMANPISKKFYAICEKYDTAYLLIGDIIFSDNFEKSSQKIQEPANLEGYIKNAYNKRLADLKAKISRAAIYSTVSIFLTKFLSLLILEYVIAVVSGGAVDYLRLFVDILVPTLLMAFLVVTIQPPSKKNLNLVIVEIMKIFYQKETFDTYLVKASRKKGAMTRFVLSLTYLMGASVSIGFIFFIFWYFAFPLYSIAINIIFIALILFAGTAIQRRAKELTIEDESSGFLMFITDILFLPITGVGRWMSNTWKDYNAITAFLNALIDMPFSMFVEFIERWRAFIREQKEELR
ncbi:hypothetical protein KW786_01215 [Candidatus Parcubacteria bacterium]|nr:hypothetical protein [Candidatus Parcubacteria bacterium]